MKYIIYISLIFLLISGKNYAQWLIQESGTTAKLNSVYFVNNDTGTTVGANGTVLKTTDGGTNWIAKTSGTSESLNGISYSQPDTGIAVGSYGTIMKTIDGCENWTMLSSGTSNILNDIFYYEGSGIAVGNNGTACYTTNGGSSWTTQVNGFFNLYGVYPTNQDTIYIAGSSGLLVRVTNFGGNITFLTSGTTNTLNSIYFINSNVGYAAGDNGTILKTEDAGNNWTMLTSGTTNNLNDIAFIDINNGIAVGDNGLIIRTTDGGMNWANDTSGTTSNLISVFFTDEIHGTIVGEGGIILRTEESLPVELTSFTATESENNVQLHWTTSTETNNRGFEIEKLNNNKNKRLKDWKNIGFIKGNGTTAEPQTYTYTDNNVSEGQYSYRLKQIDYDGAYEYSKELEVNVNNPDKFTLSQNYPNPFNPTTKIDYSIRTNGNVSLKVYDILGKEVTELVKENQKAGYYSINFNASNLPSGVYIYRIQSNDFTASKKMILMK